MRFRLLSLTINLRKENVVIEFADVSYFWGQMGAGKTSIARLVDYCLGGEIELSPAMQSEFVSATLTLSLVRGDVTIERPRDSDRVIASWAFGQEGYQVGLPARKADGEIIPGTGVEQLSDLLFWLSDIKPPRVRKSKSREDSETSRLSMRDLLWYCYLDQDLVDSSFFNLEGNAPFYLRNKSRDVLRYVIGFHDERVAELEAQLDELRGERQALTSTIAGLVRALQEVGVESEKQIAERIKALQTDAERLATEIEKARAAADAERQTSHAVDWLRGKAKYLGEEIAKIDVAMTNLGQVQDRDRRHLHEIETLSLKYRRSISAKAVLLGVTFEACPRCAQHLPARPELCCQVCGQPDQITESDPTDNAMIERDAKARISELTHILAKHDASSQEMQRRRQELIGIKSRTERERNEAMSRYDSAYLSTMLAAEREQASVLQEAENLSGLMRLPRMVETQRENLAKIVGRELLLRAKLKEARDAAESDASNLDRLKHLFLDCLVRAGVPGITSNDRVDIPRNTFFPAVYGPDPQDVAVTTFGTLSSGGKKTLFKCCFAIAVHRLAVELGAPLPELLIIDSPMKNISERENREQFEGFYRLMYELKNEELGDTQIVLIDKEFSAPAADQKFTLIERHMRPEDANNPPLIPYYVGK